MWKLIINKIKKPTIDKEIETLKEECRQLEVGSRLIQEQLKTFEEYTSKGDEKAE